MRFVQKAGISLLLACVPLTGAGCASLSPKLAMIPMVARQKSAADQYRAALQTEQQQDFVRARDQYAALQQQSPQVAAYAHRMAVVCTQLGDHATASKYFDHARQLEPGNAALLTDMGYSAIVQKDYPRAEGLLDAAVKLRPENSRAVNNLALAIGYQGRFDESLAAFRKINSESQSLTNLAYIHTQRHERERAIDCYRRAVALDPTNKAAATALAQLDTPAQPAAATPATVAASEPSLPDLSTAADPVLRHASEFETPLVRQASESQSFPKATAARPRDRLSDEDELPFFEDGEPPARSVAVAAQRTSTGAAADFEKPLIVPEEPFVPPSAFVPPAASANQTASVILPTLQQSAASVTAAPREVVETTWESEVVSPARPLPPQPLIEEKDDELARVFEDDDNRPETKMDDAEELTGLEWAQEQQAALTASTSANPETGFAETADGLKGFCPVAIRDERRLAVALDEFSFEHQAQTYRFSSAEALEKFQANPELYAPIAGGLDVVAVRRGTAIANGSLDFAVWYRHRLHLFSTTENLAAFRAAPRTFASVP
ncbi:MAG: tetratricopeptide repeat protein [Planctomycetota bacterium]